MSSPNQGPMSSANPETRLISVPYDVHAAGRSHFLIQSATGSSVQRLDSARLQLLQACSTLASAREHAWNAAQVLRQPNPAFLLSLIDELRQRELLVDEDSILRKACEGSPKRVAPLDSLFIRSSGRPVALTRALLSLRPFAHRLKRCVIIDDTRSDADRAAIDRVVEKLRPEMDCALIHFKREQRNPLVHQLAQAANANPDQLGWFIDTPSDRSDGYGCGVNLALLLSAGQRMLMLDDDATLEAFRTDNTTAPAIAAYHMLPGSGLETERFAAKRVELDPIEAHDNILGRTAGEIPAAPETIERATPEMLLWFKPDGKIRFTSNGVFGDPGTRQPHWLFWQSADALSPWRDAERYQQSLHQRRSIRREAGPRIIVNYSVMTTTMTGIDNSEPLAPTLPFSVGEDTALGELMRYTDPGSLLHCADWMLWHDPETPRHWSREDVAAPMTHNVGTFFKKVLANHAWSCTSRSRKARMKSLDALMNDIASAECHDLRHELLRQTLESRSRLCQTLEAKREQWSGCDHVVQDIDRMLDANRSGHWHPDDDPEADLTSIHRLAEGYSKGLHDWLAAWHAAREQSSVKELLAALD